MIFNKLVGFF